MAITISSITRADVPRYIEFLRAGFGSELGELGTDLNRLERIISFLLLGNELPLRVIKWVSKHEAFVLLAHNGDKPIGCLTVVGRQPALTGAYVVPEFRGQGIALKLVNAAVARLREAGYRRVIASPLNIAAQRLIEKAGFTPVNRTVVYEHMLPLDLTPPSGVRIRRMRAADVSSHNREWHGRRYNVRGVGWLLGIHMRRLTAVTTRGAAVSARLFTIARERVGELHPILLVPGEGRALLGLLAIGERWFTRMGKEAVYVSLSPRDEELIALLRALGFAEKREWVEFGLDLNKSGADRAAPRDY